MVEINGTNYNLCLLDTNAVSEIVKNRNEEFKKYLDKLFPEKYIPCFSVFTIAELQQRQDLFSKFMDLFTFFPSGIVKGHGDVIKEEIENYPNYQKIFPLSMSVVGLQPYKDYTKRETVELLFNSEPYTKYRKQHLAQRQQVLSDIESNIKSFFDERGKYTETEMWIYLHWYVLQEIYIRSSKFAEIRRKNHIQIDIKAFPTILMMAYVTFYKFQRKIKIENPKNLTYLI